MHSPGTVLVRGSLLAFVSVTTSRIDGPAVTTWRLQSRHSKRGVIPGPSHSTGEGRRRGSFLQVIRGPLTEKNPFPTTIVDSPGSVITLQVKRRETYLTHFVKKIFCVTIFIILFTDVLDLPTEKEFPISDTPPPFP